MLSFYSGLKSFVTVAAKAIPSSTGSVRFSKFLERSHWDFTNT